MENLAGENVAQQGGQPAASRGLGSVKLPTFWSTSPAAWFRAVEAQFIIRDVTSHLDRYYLVLGARSEFQVAKVMAVMEEEPKEESYGRI
jgi:hypothetical protein